MGHRPGAGLPQLLIAESWYALHKGRHLEGVGAGLYVSDRAQSRASLARLLDDPSFGACARRLRDEQITAQPTPGEVVPVLEKLTAHHR